MIFSHGGSLATVDVHDFSYQADIVLRTRKMSRERSLLQSSPTLSHLARLYYELGKIGSRTVGKKVQWPYGKPDRETLLALAAEMARYDPRLFEALAELLGRTWNTFSPLRVRQLMLQMHTPQVFGVLGAFVQQLDATAECAYFFEYLMRGWKPVSPQLFYQHHYAPGSRRALRAATESVAEFRAWGFCAEQGPVLSQANKRAAGTYGNAARQNIVSRMLTHHPTITVKEYLTAVHYSISRQQAYADLKAYPGLTHDGRGRGSRWRIMQTTA